MLLTLMAVCGTIYLMNSEVFRYKIKEFIMKNRALTKLGYVVVTDYVKANTGKDVSDALQKVIDSNPNKTIYFPDGEYLLSKPILTPADPEKSVSLKLSNYAKLKAADNWMSDEAMVRLGASHPKNDINTPGSNYFFEGGIIDGSNIANGISIDGGRETAIRNLSIKRTVVGLTIKCGANNGSSDCDIDTVNIVGNGTPESIGVVVDGADNTFTNMRIANFQTGVKITGAGNFLKNIHPLFIYQEDSDFNHKGGVEYAECIGFDDQSGGNWYDICYPDNYATGFRMLTKTVSTYNNCYCYWYSSKGGFETAFESEGQFNSIITASKVDFRDDTDNAFLKVGEAGGTGVLANPMFKPELCANKSYEDYLQGKIIYRTK